MTNKNEPMFAFECVCESFVSQIDESYSLGDSDAYLRNYSFPVDYQPQLHLRAVSIMIARNIQGHSNDKILKVLFDSGSDKTLINRRVLPAGSNPKTVKGIPMTGVHSTNVHDQEVLLSDISLPEFSPSLKVPGPIRATVFNNQDTAYDIIIGIDTLTVLGIDIMCSTKTVCWNDIRIPFHPRNYFSDPHFTQMLIQELEADPLDSEKDIAEASSKGYKSNVILHSKYERVDTKEAAQKQVHLSSDKRKDLETLFSKCKKLFSGVLDTYPGKKIHLELLDNIQPKYCRPYPVPHHHWQVFKDELDRLVQIGILKPFRRSAWL